MQELAGVREPECLRRALRAPVLDGVPDQHRRVLQQQGQFVGPFRGGEFGPVVGGRAVAGAQVEGVRGREAERRGGHVEVSYDAGEKLLLGLLREFEDGREDGVLAAGVSVDAA